MGLGARPLADANMSRGAPRGRPSIRATPKKPDKAAEGGATKLAAKDPTAPATAEALQWHSLHQWTPKKKVGSAPSDQESSKARPGSPSATKIRT